MKINSTSGGFYGNKIFAHFYNSNIVNNLLGFDLDIDDQRTTIVMNIALKWIRNKTNGMIPNAIPM